jgi:hypothetical protein
MAARGLLEPCKYIENGGFSAARVANNADKLSAMQFEIDIVKNDQIFGSGNTRKCFLEALDLKKAHRAAPNPDK